MATLKRTGGLVSLRWRGGIPDPSAPAFAAALAAQRFRTIQTAASEEVSVGWITQADPTGDTFDLEDLDAGNGRTWLRVRIDRKKLPAKWVQHHIDAASKARGRPLRARERRELKDELAEQLLPRVLPSTNLVDALMVWDRHLVLLLSSSKGVREAFASLFFATFGKPLDRDEPGVVALRVLGDQKVVQALNPIRWPVVGRKQA